MNEKSRAGPWTSEDGASYPMNSLKTIALKPRATDAHSMTGALERSFGLKPAQKVLLPVSVLFESPRSKD